MHPYTESALSGKEPPQVSCPDELELTGPFPQKEPSRGKVIPMTGTPDYFQVTRDEPMNQSITKQVSQGSSLTVDSVHQRGFQMDH